MCKFALSTLFLCLSAIVNAQIGHRTVIDKELGSLYQPGSIPWAAYGMFVGSPATLDSQAYRVLMAHFDQFAPVGLERAG
jgi:hypothetical protein